MASMRTNGHLCLLVLLIAWLTISSVTPSSSLSVDFQIPSDWSADFQSGNLLYSPKLPSDSVLMPSVANGYLATVVLSDTQYLGGVFNGPQVSTNNPSHRAAIPATGSFQVANTTAVVTGAALDLSLGVFYLQTFLPGVASPTDGLVIQQSWFAHQTERSLLVVQVDIVNNSTQDIIVAWNQTTSNSSDISFTQLPVINGTVMSMEGSIITPEDPNNGTYVKVAVVYTAIPQYQTIPANSQAQYYYITAMRSSLDSSDPISDALSDYEQAMADPGSLFSSHSDGWTNLWTSGIEVGGNLALAQAINSSLSYILGSVRSDWPWSLSPGGLASNSYNGHTFWDAETWMYPPLLMLHSEIAAGGVLQYRFNHMEGAREKAMSYNSSYAGTMFPWESAFSGLEVCPLSAPTGQLEQHISGDIAAAIRDYWYVTNDLDWLESTGFPLIQGIAEFYASRIILNVSLGEYVIDGVIPPDEFAVNVSNSIYTNAVAQIALLFATEAGGLLGIETPAEWVTLANNLRLPFDIERQIHLEYDGYTNETIKQADVVLLSYPLMFPMTDAVRSNDLRYYSSVTTSDGPAMTWSIYAIGWLDDGNETAASIMFNMSYANIQPPFNVWQETPTGGAVNFLTGAGGFLQGVINGYGGIRIQKEELTWRPILPPETSSMKLRSINYLGNAISLSFNATTMTITLEEASSQSQPLVIVDSQGNAYPVIDSVSFPIGSASIKSKTSNSAIRIV